MTDEYLSERQIYTFKRVWEDCYKVAIDMLMKHEAAKLPAMNLTIPCIDAAFQCDTGKRGPDDHYSGKEVLTWLVQHKNSNLSDLQENALITHLSKHFTNWLKHNAFIGDHVVLHDRYLNGKPARVPVDVRFDENTGKINQIMISPTLWWEMVKDVVDKVYRNKPDCIY